MTKEELINKFDCNAPGILGNLFGLPFTPAIAEMVIMPVPWEVTVSYHTGTAGGPAAILAASSQVDLAVKDIPDAWKLGVTMLPIPEDISQESRRLRDLAAKHIETLARGEILSDNPLLKKVNEGSESLNIYTRSTALKWLSEGKMVAMIGGDHSTPLGFIRALSENTIGSEYFR